MRVYGLEGVCELLLSMLNLGVVVEMCFLLCNVHSGERIKPVNHKVKLL